MTAVAPDTVSAAHPQTDALHRFFARNLLVHTHLEKAAGSTLVRSLMQVFGSAHIADLRGRDARRPDVMAPNERAAVWLLSGHFHFGTRERCFDRRAIYIATVRDPFERFRSFHAFVSARPGHPAYPLIGQRPLGDAVEIALRERYGCACGYLCRYFSGTGRWRASARARAHLERRYAAVVPHRHVGRLAGSVADTFGLPPPPVMSRNVGTDYPRSDDGREWFIRHNPADYEIYAYVNARWEAWLAAFPERLRAMAR